MQISVLKKLLQLISPSDSPEEAKSLEETSEQEENEIMQIAECSMQNDDADEICAEGEEDSAAERATLSENNRSHLTSSVPRAARVPAGVMTKGELAEIRELFKNLDDTEIQRLYKRVTKNN